MGYDALNHSEVIKMGSEFIATEETMQRILIGKYPILLIDESQDTKKELVDALLITYEKYKDRFIIGMFGDTMQRIYMDGKDNLASCIPDEWEKPEKVMNHRSATRIVDLANSIRKTVDKQQQRSRSDAELGTVRLFIADALANKEEMEHRAAQIMAERADDTHWLSLEHYKSLILEHHMAASRFGFLNLYTPLNDSKSFETSLRDGSISEISFLYNVVSPLVKAYKDDNEFEVSRIVRKHSPLFDKKSFRENSADQNKILETADRSVEELLLLWKNSSTPTCTQVLEAIKGSNLFALSERVDDILSEPAKGEGKKVAALREALSVPFDELEKYSEYVTDKTRFCYAPRSERT